MNSFSGLSAPAQYRPVNPKPFLDQSKVPTADFVLYIVDDNEDVRNSISFMLATCGQQCRAFAGGGEFLEAVPNLQPGCVLLDIRMPGVDGLEVLFELKQAGIDWPVLVMTGHGEVALAVQAMKLGALDFLEKPFEETLLLSCLERAGAMLG